jgi:hypothetical protein
MKLTARNLLVIVCLSALILPSPGSAATVSTSNDWCGTHPTGAEVALAQSDFLARRAERLVDRDEGFLARSALVKASGPQVSQVGDVIIIQDDGTIIQEPNATDISNTGIRVTKKRKNLKLSKKGSGIGGDLGRRITLGDDDTAEIPFEGNFSFKFFGKKYKKAFVNSDGNITFGEGDNASTARDLGRTLNGPARVMAYFVDLDPSVGGEVWVKFSGKKMTITWLNVPEWGGFAPNTFQVTLFKKGHVEFRFGEISADTGIIGISPGGNASVKLVDFTEEVPSTVAEQAIAEVFGTEEIVDEGGVARVFYDIYPDDVEQIVLYYDFVLPLLGGNAVAYHFTIKNEVKGIGYKNFRSSETFDNSGAMGSNGVLEGFANMGYVHKYGDNLNKLRDTITHLGVLIHELGHQWLSRVFFKQSGQSNPDLQENGGHWAFTTDTDASFMQGNEIQDNGDGSFTTLEKDAIFSQMDKYMLGIVPPEDVPDFFYVDNSGANAGQLPEWGFNLFGDRRDVSVDDVIREEGARSPNSEESQKDFRMAMILLVKQGAEPQQRSIDKVQDFADRLENKWSDYTDGIGSFDATVSPK